MPGLVHKTDAGTVQLDLRTETDVRNTYRSLSDRFGNWLRWILEQPMISNRIEVIVGVADDRIPAPRRAPRRTVGKEPKAFPNELERPRAVTGELPAAGGP